tara:strand:- start:8312 stop:8665 length:354 start_codon:yes stop_codon:yes gene_type:complete
MASTDPRTPDPIVNDPEFAELVDYFRGELPARVQSLERSVAECDLDSVRRIAHQLKGAAPGFGFPDVGRAAQVLEEGLMGVGPDGRRLETMRAELESLIRLCRSYYADAHRGDRGPD